MAKISRPKDRPASMLKQIVLSNLRRLEERRAGPLLQRYYGRWGDLAEGERAHVFRIEAALDRGIFWVGG